MVDEHTRSIVIGNLIAADHDGGFGRSEKAGSATWGPLDPEMPKNHPDFAQVEWLPSRQGWGVSGSVCMSSSSVYRTNAEDCLRMARTAQDERDKPFWLTLAQSWLHLAEHSARSRADFQAEKSGIGSGAH